MTRTVTRIAVAVATRRRPRMLADLMQSFLALDVPQGAELVFVVVENDDEMRIAETVETFEKRSGWRAMAVLEPRPGISHARNTAMDAAREVGADWLAFVDDDELVRHDWLRILWAGAREAEAQLAGGPLKPVAPKAGCSDDEEHVLRYLVAAAAKNDARKVVAARTGKRFDLATNNWIVDLAALEAHGLRFDPEYGLSGGEDTDLSRRAHAAGLTLAWVKGAIVTEEVPPERLTTAYLFERSRHQSITKLHLACHAARGSAKLSAVVQIAAKTCVGAVRIAVSPVLGRYHYYSGVRSLGIAAGFLAGLRGARQEQYSEVTGE
jgi:succinoglycan biosynthesis protein ExoM